MRRLRGRWLIVTGSCLAVTAAGVSAAMADDEAPAVGHGFHTGTVPLTTSFNGDVYEMKDATRGHTTIYDSFPIPSVVFTDDDNDWGNGGRVDRQSMAVDAMYALSKSWDYFANVHRRTGIASDGQGITVYGSVPGRTDYNNGWPRYFPAASGRDAKITYSYAQPLGMDGSARQADAATLDLIGSAFAKGVAVAAGLPDYWDSDSSPADRAEANGLANATADIFGTMIEFYANNRLDPPDYTIGERVIAAFPDVQFRWHPVSMPNPGSLTGHPEDNCWSASTKNSKYPALHFFYLLAAGTNPESGVTSPTCNSLPVTGIGNDKAAKIWYRALTTYFTVTTNYKTARIATLKAAADLYGTHGLEYNTVKAAWNGISVTAADPFPGGQTPYPVNPGDQVNPTRTALSLQIEATNPGGRALTHSAAGLPPGLTMSPSGLISGTPTTKGEYKVTIGVTDTLHAQGSTWFMWSIT
jgi:hypothetical protein